MFVPGGMERDRTRDAAANLEFEKAAALRDELVNLCKQIGGNESLLFQGKAHCASWSARSERLPAACTAA